MTFKNSRQRKAFFARLKQTSPKFSFQERLKLREHFRLRRQVWEHFIVKKLNKQPQDFPRIARALSEEKFKLLRPIIKRQKLTVKEQAQLQVQFKNAVKNQRKQKVFGDEIDKAEFNQALKMLKSG